MMKRKIYVFLLMMCVITQLHAQKKLTIAVSDTQGNRLPYPEIVIGADFHRVGTEQGTLEVSSDAIRLHDLLTVKYMGYKTTQIPLDSIHLSNGVIHVNLEEDTYLLDPVIVLSGKFSAEKYFKKQKKNLLLPYYNKYFFDLNFVFENGSSKNHTYTGHVWGMSHRTRTDIDSASLVISEPISDSTKLFTVLKRASEISYLVADIFCHKSDRKNFHCTYRGEVDDFKLWEFSIRKQKKMPWNIEENDEFRCIVSLDKKGFINRIKTQLTSSSEHSVSYLLDTEYSLYKRELIPLVVKIDVVPNACNEKSNPLSFVLNYSNFREKKD